MSNPPLYIATTQRKDGGASLRRYVRERTDGYRHSSYLNVSPVGWVPTLFHINRNHHHE